jgi:hypothetical protein
MGYERSANRNLLRTSGGRGRRTGHKQAPSRRPRHIVFARPLVVAHRNAPKQTEDRARGLVEFLLAIAAELETEQTAGADIGPGLIHRVASRLQHRYGPAPQPMAGKYART